MCKIKKIHKVIVNRLPKKYNVPIRLYKSVRGMLSSVAKEIDCEYKYVGQYFSKYLENTKYVNSKYYRSDSVDNSYKNIVAISGNPIKIVTNNVDRRNDCNIAVLILHELHHTVNKEDDDIKCDKFATRWCRKLIKEKLIRRQL